MGKDKSFYYGSAPSVFQKAGDLRKKLTGAEYKLWQELRRKNLEGLKFRRQHPIGRFIADFYCHEKLLVVEVDGGIHDEKDQKEYDQARTYQMNELGLRVIRFSNEEVWNEIEKVVEEIRRVVKEG